MPTHPDPRQWPVLAWIRMRLPEAPPMLQLTPGPPPPPLPPLEILAAEAVATDPTVRLYSYSERLGNGSMRIAWTASNPELLNAEYREPDYVARPSPEVVRAFWAAVKEKVGELGPLSVEAADPYPR
jgi:hypothetical protein